jgi:hypothetical protein
MFKVTVLRDSEVQLGSIPVSQSQLPAMTFAQEVPEGTTDDPQSQPSGITSTENLNPPLGCLGSELVESHWIKVAFANTVVP